jgi:hypothetical protein
MADPTTDMVNALSPEDQAAMQPETFANPLVKKKIDNLVKIMSIPGQALSSEQPMTTQDMLQPARDMTGQFGAIGLPMAKAGTAGIFGGKLAQGADLRALQEAKQMAAGGKLPGQIMNDTGWMRTPTDNQWKFEIPDNKSALKFMPQNEGDLATGSVQSLMSHPELFKHYPQLQGANMSITRQGGDPSGLWEGPTPMSDNPINSYTAHVVAPDMRSGRSIALHELQHGVQGIEGFSAGNNPAYYAAEIERGMRNQPNQFQGYDFNKIASQADELYRKTAGEVEARNVQHRAGFSPLLRRQPEGMPWATQDVKYIDQFHYDPTLDTLTALRDKR